ncbi:MAG: hypothetical protein GY730_10585 [bacterium]|nr:hypothetical protein [bacterium]
MKLKEVFKNSIFCFLFVVSVLSLTGCGKASSTTSPESNVLGSNVSLEQKEAVLQAIANAFNEGNNVNKTKEHENVTLENKAASITNASSRQSLFIQSQSEEKDPSLWRGKATDLGFEQKESFNLGMKEYQKTRFTGKNDFSGETGIFTSWEYEIDTGKKGHYIKDRYIKSELELYTKEAHMLIHTVADETVVEDLMCINTIPVYNSTMLYKSGLEFIITDGYSTSTVYNTIKEHHIYLITSLSMPFILKYDADNDGVKENYNGTLSATDLDSRSTTDYTSSTVADENGVIYGQVQIYNDGSAKVIPSE